MSDEELVERILEENGDNIYIASAMKYLESDKKRIEIIEKVLNSTEYFDKFYLIETIQSESEIFRAIDLVIPKIDDDNDIALTTINNLEKNDEEDSDE